MKTIYVEQQRGASRTTAAISGKSATIAAAILGAVAFLASLSGADLTAAIAAVTGLLATDIATRPAARKGGTI